MDNNIKTIPPSYDDAYIIEHCFSNTEENDTSTNTDNVYNGKVNFRIPDNTIYNDIAKPIQVFDKEIRNLIIDIDDHMVKNDLVPNNTSTNSDNIYNGKDNLRIPENSLYYDITKTIQVYDEETEIRNLKMDIDNHDVMNYYCKECD